MTSSAGSTSSVCLHHVSLFLRPFLCSASRSALATLNRSWSFWEEFGDCPLARPSSPFRRRHRGFGKVNQNLHVRHLSPSPYFILHKAWDFLSPVDWHQVALAAPAFQAYTCLHRSLATVSISNLRLPRPPPSTFTGLQHDRAWRLAVALL